MQPAIAPVGKKFADFARVQVTMWVRSYLTDLRERQNLSPNVTLLQLLGTNEEEIGKELLQNAEAESLLDFRQISDLEAWLKDAEKSIV
ncbi:hypothetical protein U9R62_10460 [Cylindrospermopsis raciborskii DSH]